VDELASKQNSTFCSTHYRSFRRRWLQYRHLCREQKSSAKIKQTNTKARSYNNKLCTNNLVHAHRL